MENEEKKELQAEAPKMTRPRKRSKSTGFSAEAAAVKEEVKPVEEKKVEPAPAPISEPKPEPTPTPKPVPAPRPVARVAVKPIAKKPVPPTRKARVSRPLKNDPNTGTQRGIRNRG